MSRYTVHSFTTDPANRYTDLSAFFNTPGVANPSKVNQTWTMKEMAYDLNMSGWSGTVNSEGALEGGPSGHTFYEPYGYPGYMEIQVTDEDSPQCPAPPSPWPYAGGGGGGGGCGTGQCGA